MFRVHQFQKVEMVAYIAPDESWDEHERLLALEESLVQEVGLPYRVRQQRGGRSLERGGEALRHRGVVPVAGALPRDHVVLEHDRLPGAALGHPLPRRREAPRDAAHAERHRRHGPLGARDPRELRRRRPRRAAAVRRARARHQVDRSRRTGSERELGSTSKPGSVTPAHRLTARRGAGAAERGGLENR